MHIKIMGFIQDACHNYPINKIQHFAGKVSKGVAGKGVQVAGVALSPVLRGQ